MMLQMTMRMLVVYGLMTVLLKGDDLLAEDVVTIEPQAEALVVKIRDQEFTVYHFGRELPKSYFWPVRADDGTILTRPIEPGEKEHPHHKGIWLAVDEVNDIKFWAEKGKIALREISSSSGNPATIKVKHDWMGRDGSVTLHEATRISIYPDRMLVFDIELTTPTGKLVRFDDTKEGFLAIRIAQSMRELEGGKVVNSDDFKTTKDCWGRYANWVDYTGNVNGKQYGVTLMDFPENFRRSRYHVRDYGLFSISPFGEGAYQNDPEKSKPVILTNIRTSIRARYGILIHDGEPTGTSDAYHLFLKRAADPVR